MDADSLTRSLEALGAAEPKIAAALERAGYPQPRVRPRGYETLLRTIIGQQVSVKAAASIWDKLAGIVGDVHVPAAMLAASDADLRAAGLSRQKAAYARSLAEHVTAGTLDLDALPEDDEEAIARLVDVKGIGRWSAEIYLLFAEGRPDIWPAGDLAVQIEAGRIMGLEGRPTERQTRALAEAWRPHRGAAAVLMWHSYNTGVI